MPLRADSGAIPLNITISQIHPRRHALNALIGIESLTATIWLCDESDSLWVTEKANH